MLPSEPRPTRWDLHWRMLGCEVRIRPVFWASCLLLGLVIYRDPDLGGMAMFWFWIAAVLISLLAHEASHVLAARLFAARIRIVLSGLGGQVFGLDEAKRWQRVLILLAGSLGNLLLAGILWGIANPQWNPLPIDRLGADRTIFIANAVKIALLINAFWALLNVLPLWPLDGGRVAVEICEALLGRRGQTLALLASLFVCLGLILTVAGWATITLVPLLRAWRAGFLILDVRFPVNLLYFCIQALYCYFFWICTFRALWGDPVPLDEAGKSGRAA
jgi:stage IV sporulation protein FB